MPDENLTPTEQPDFVAMKRLDITTHWWVKMPHGRMDGPYTSADAAEEAFAERHRKAIGFGLGVQFAAAASVVTTTRYYLETAPALAQDATSAARNRNGGDRW